MLVPTHHVKGYPKDYKTVCPFGIRDLSHDVCYSGGGKNRCPYFVRYDWSDFDGYIICKHKGPISNGLQLTLDFNL